MNWQDEIPRHSEPCRHVKWSELQAHMPKEELERFAGWMCGQTMMSGDGGESLVFEGDFDRWLEQGMKEEQGADWH